MVRYALTAAGLAVLLAGCGDPSKEDILRQADGLDTKQELEAVLGPPGDISKMGPVETWTYAASNGAVSFVMAGERVTMSSTSDARPAH